MSRLIIVSVGTDHHPFDRLVTSMDKWASAHPDDKVIVQHGTASAPSVASGQTLIPHPELCELFAKADVVICHGGPSTVMDARIAGKKPVVLPRDPQLGEHVDGHQMRFAKHLEKHGLARTLDSEEMLDEVIEEVLASPEDYQITEGFLDAPRGVVQFGSVVDELLGTKTTLRTPATKLSEEVQS